MLDLIKRIFLVEIRKRMKWICRWKLARSAITSVQMQYERVSSDKVVFQEWSCSAQSSTSRRLDHRTASSNRYQTRFGGRWSQWQPWATGTWGIWNVSDISERVFSLILQVWCYSPRRYTSRRLAPRIRSSNPFRTRSGGPLSRWRPWAMVTWRMMYSLSLTL